MTTSDNPTDHERFTSARRRRHDASYSNLTPGIEKVSFEEPGIQDAAVVIETTIVTMFDPESRLLTATIAERHVSADGPFGSQTTTSIDDVLRWIEQDG